MGQAPPVHRPRRDATGVVIVACAAVVVSTTIIAAGVGAGSPWVFEVLAITGLLVGLGVAFGVLDRGPSAPLRRRYADPTPELSATVEAQLRALDPVEHRRLDLGAPWPTVVIGPTGVTVVAVASQVDVTSERRLRDVLHQVRGLTHARIDERTVEVRALLVVPDHLVPLTRGGEVQAVPVGELSDAVARGPLLPMATVTALFDRLSGQLAPDLQADAV